MKRGKIMINSVTSGSSAFYLPTQGSKIYNEYFYQMFRQALESGCTSGEALAIAREKTVKMRQEDKKRKVESNTSLDNDTKRRE